MIGCGADFVTGNVWFTRNGSNLGVAANLLQHAVVDPRAENPAGGTTTGEVFYLLHLRFILGYRALHRSHSRRTRHRFLLCGRLSRASASGSWLTHFIRRLFKVNVKFELEHVKRFLSSTSPAWGCILLGSASASGSSLRLRTTFTPTASIFSKTSARRSTTRPRRAEGDQQCGT